MAFPAVVIVEFQRLADLVSNRQGLPFAGVARKCEYRLTRINDSWILPGPGGTWILSPCVFWR